MARIFLDFPGIDDRERRRRVDGNVGEREGAPDDSPPMDVLETEAAIEVVVDLPGIERDAVTVMHRDGSLLITGYKRPTRCDRGHAAFHLAERSFGRFSRGVALGGAFDASRATATLAAGELRIIVPRVMERRGRETRISVETPEPDSRER